MPRVRNLIQGGAITDNPMTSSALSFNSVALANLPAISSGYMPVVIYDPTYNAGSPEVVWLTAHTLTATVATVTRAQEGSTARNHLQGEIWVAGPTVLDYFLYLAAGGTVPTASFEGQEYWDEGFHQDFAWDGTKWAGDADEGLFWMN